MNEQDQKVPLDYATPAIQRPWHWVVPLLYILSGIAGLFMIFWRHVTWVLNAFTWEPQRDPWANEKIYGYLIGGLCLVIFSLVRYRIYVRRRRQ